MKLYTKWIYKIYIQDIKQDKQRKNKVDIQNKQDIVYIFGVFKRFVHFTRLKG